MSEQVISIVDGVRGGETEEKKTCVEAKTFFTRTVKDIVSGIKEKEVKVIFKRMHIGYLYVDVRKIKRAVQNIIGNAVKYSKEKLCLTVQGSLWGDRYFLRIKDNGIGIKKADRSHVFDKFYMVDKSRGKGGSGLGLHICKEFMAENGGEIGVRSDGKSWSEFYLAFPLVKKDERKRFTERFENINKGTKFLLMVFFGWFISAAYRFTRYDETKCPSTLIAGILGFLLVFPNWIMDTVSEVVYNRFTFLAD